MHVTPREILQLLTKQSGGLERLDVVNLLAKIPTLWATDPRVPEYINTIKDAQRKVLRAALPMSDDHLAAFATTLILAENSFPNDRPAWDGKPPNEKTWQKWKDTFLPLHRALEREKLETMGRKKTCGSTTSALATHMIDPSRVQQPAPQFQKDAQTLDDHFDDLAAAATTSNYALETLSTVTGKQNAKITELLKELWNMDTGNQAESLVTPNSNQVSINAKIQV